MTEQKSGAKRGRGRPPKSAVRRKTTEERRAERAAKNNEIADKLEPTNLIARLILERTTERPVIMAALHQSGHTADEISKMLGCVPSNVYIANQSYKRSPKLKHKVDQLLDGVIGTLPERYKASRRLKLAQIVRIDDAALEAYEANPELAIRKPQLLKQQKQAAGVLDGDEVRVASITIQQLNILRGLVAGALGDGEVIDGEITALPEGKNEK